MACPKIACECHPGGRKMRKLGARVLLWGDSYAATDTAAFLADIGKQVTIVTENREFAADCEVIHMYVLRKRFAQGDAEVLHSRPYKHPVTVHHEHDGGRDPRRRGRPPGQGLRPDDPRGRRRRDLPHPAGRALFGELRAAGVDVINVGDAVRPRNLYHAVKEGSAFGLAVDEHLLFNPNGAILNDLPIDVLAQLTREEGPAYYGQADAASSPEPAAGRRAGRARSRDGAGSIAAARSARRRSTTTAIDRRARCRRARPPSATAARIVLRARAVPGRHPGVRADPVRGLRDAGGAPRLPAGLPDRRGRHRAACGA